MFFNFSADTMKDAKNAWGGESFNCAGVLGEGTAGKAGVPTGACDVTM